MHKQNEQPRKGIIDFFVQLEKNIQEEFAKSDRKYTVEELAARYEKETDAIIIEAIRYEKLTFIGGKLFIQLSADQLGYEVGMEAYFQRTDGEWVIKKNLTKPFKLDIILLDSRTELMKLKRIEFELTKPE